MAKSLFQVTVSVKPKVGGQAELTPAKSLKGVEYRFVAVKEGGDEAIVMVEGPEAELKALEKDKHCRKLTPKQADTLRHSYPALKVKKKFRLQPSGGRYETDENGQPIVDTIQTVRSGFYLIDVPVVSE